MPWRCCIQYVSKSERLTSGHRTGKDQSSSQFPRKGVLKNVLTIRQPYSSPVLVRSCLKSCMLGFSIMRNMDFQMTKLDLEKTEEPEIKLPTFAGSKGKLWNSRKKSTSVSSSVPKPLTVWINCRKLLKSWGYQTILSVYWETCMRVKKQQLEPCMEQLIGSRLKKEHDRAVCCHPVCLTYMLSTPWEMLGLDELKLQSRQAGVISTTSDMQMIPL